MSPARIEERRNGDGSVTFRVVYRRGGRAFRQESGGSFRGFPGGKTGTGNPAPSVGAARREAQTRRDLVGGWLASGRDPATELAHIRTPARLRKLMDTYDAWMRSRHDVGEKRHTQYRQARTCIVQFFGDDKHTETVTVQDCREYVGWLAERYKPATVRTYYHPLGMALEFAEVEPNPARHRSVRMPRLEKTEPVVMSGAQFRAVIAALPVKWRLFFRLLEATGMRVGELLYLQWGDVDFAENRFRVSVARTKGRSGGQRWVQVPAALVDELADTLPFDDRQADRRVFRQFTRDGAKTSMVRACKHAGVPHFTPHSLRHRRLSLWHFQHVPVVEVARRAGHTKPDMTLRVYSHVMVDPTDDEWFMPNPGPTSERRSE